jgi:hypothetical protein
MRRATSVAFYAGFFGVVIWSSKDQANFNQTMALSCSLRCEKEAGHARADHLKLKKV